MIRVAIAATCVVVAACAPRNVQAEPAQLAFLGGDEFPTGMQFRDTTVGGLSGITYDPDRQVYYVISDDKSEHNPARFYTMRIPLTDSGIGDVEFVDTHAWQDVSGVLDPEDIAFDRQRQVLYWSSEGDDSWIRIAGLDGSYRGEFTLPPILERTPDERSGPRFNAGLEGLTLTPSGQFVWAAMEEPGYNDGDPATADTGALTRVTKFDVASRAAVAQYAYPLDPIPAPRGDANGLTALVALDDDTFLTVERSHGTHNVARVYRTEVGGAQDVLNLSSLRGADPAPMSKSLMADLSVTAGAPALDNLEGITLGPALPGGRQSVVLVSDNNFNPAQVTQILAFAM